MASNNEIDIPHPPIASQEDWLRQRMNLLAEEKDLTRRYDRINADRRRLPMVPVEKSYTFHGAEGDKSLLNLFEGQQQLIVYHFMFGPDDEAGCPGCTSYVNSLGDLSLLGERSTNMVLVSRGPYQKLAKYREEHGWSLPWFSSAGSDFNYDFGVTLDPNRGPLTYNYKTPDQLPWLEKLDKPDEMPGTSVFFRLGNEIYHTYSTYARGGESLTDSYRLLDITPYGRQESFEDSPQGWPQRPTYG